MERKNHLIKFLKGEFITAYSRIIAKMNYIIQTGHLRIRLISIEKVFPDSHWHCPKHSHVYYEFHIIADGKGTITIGDESFTVRKGSFFITGPGVKHTQTSDPDDPMFEYCIKLHLQVINDPVYPDISQKQESLAIVQTLAGTYKYPFLDIYDIKSMIDDLYKEIAHKNPGYTVAFQNKIIEIVNSFYRTICNVTTHINHNSLKNYKNHEEHIHRIVEFVTRNFTKEITIADLEQHMILGAKQINRIMKKEFGITFHEYLHNLRLAKVRQLAKETILTTEQIASQCGFANVRNLYQSLKKYNCPTPSQIRAETVK